MSALTNSVKYNDVSYNQLHNGVYTLVNACIIASERSGMWNVRVKSMRISKLLLHVYT